jgi:DNA-binding MarR family transcriptional regulator
MQRRDGTDGLIDLLERAGRLIQGALHSGGLPPAQWHVLRYLARANRFSRTPTAIGLYLDATKGTVSQTIIALERKGLVSKERNPDRRSVCLQLTARGRELLARHPLSEAVEALEALPPQARDALRNGLAAFLMALLARRSARPFGQCATCRFFEHGGAPSARGGPHRCKLLDTPLSADDAAQICVEQEARQECDA